MTARFFADTNGAIYPLDGNEQKRRQALDVMRRHPVISTQVVNEFLNVLMGKRKHSGGAVRQRRSRHG